MGFLVDPSAPEYHHAGSRNGVIRCQTALWSGPGATPSPPSPGSYTWSLRWPALSPTLNAPLSKWLPGPVWPGWAWAGPGWPRWVAPPPPQGPHGCKFDQIMSFLADPSVPKYHNAGSRHGDIWCRMALWSGPGATPSPRSARLCTWALRWPALEPTLKRPFGAPELRPGRFWHCQRLGSIDSIGV